MGNDLCIQDRNGDPARIGDERESAEKLETDRAVFALNRGKGAIVAGGRGAAGMIDSRQRARI